MLAPSPTGPAPKLVGLPTPTLGEAAIDLRTAIENVLARPEPLALALQPVVDLQRGTVVGYEALARFPPEPGASPDHWFAEAQRIGLQAELEARAIVTALTVRPSLPANCFLSVNGDPNILGTPELLATFGAAGRLNGMVIELTEHAEVHDYDSLRSVVARLRKDGATIAVDDAGTGYASLQHILALRPELVKLDRALVTGIDRDGAKLALVEMLGTFASRVDAWIFAEGIERVEELDALVRLRVPLGQGYLLGHPAPGWTELESALAQRIRARVEAAQGVDSVAALVEPVEAVPVTGARERAARLFLAHADSVVPALDEWERPVALLERGDGHTTREVMRVKPESQVTDVARRAMTRPPETRFNPVVCCDGRGRYLGIVRIERLVERLGA